MESTEERILHYQRGIDRSVSVLDKPRLLHCIKALSKLPVTMRHLKSTGIGRTVNSLRKIEDGVGDASKRLVTKWKEMVSNAPDSGDSDEACVPDDPDNYESVNYDQENSSPTDNNAVDNDYLDGYNGISRPEALDRPVLSPPMVIDVNVTPEEDPVPNLSEGDDEPEETNYCETTMNSSNKDKESKKDSKSVNSSKHSSSKDKKELSKVLKTSKDNGHDEHKKKDKDKDRYKSKSESSSSKDKKHSSEVKKRKVESSDEESNQKKQRLSVCENESDNDEEPSNNFVIDNDVDDEDEESSSNERDSEVRESLKDRHKESSLKHSDKSSSSSSSKSKDKRSSSSSSKAKSSSSSHESPSSSSKKDKSSEERSKKDDKHKSKSSHNSSSSSSSKVHNGKDKDKHISSNSTKEDDKEKSKNDEMGKVKDKKEHKKSKEHKEKKKSKKTTIDGIDSMSGTSFADALGMCSMPPPKKKKDSSLSKPSSKAESSSHFSPQSSPTKSSPSKSKTEYKPSSSPAPDSPEDSLALLAPNAKLEPLSGDLNEEVDLASTLPEPSPFYKPLPQINHTQRRVDEEAMLSQVINAKVQRTKVYSGNKSGWTTVPSLQEICIRVLIENIDALEYTGGVPFDILKPILERATADQLFILEYHNPYLVEESDQLWKFHCNKYFKSKQREEMESWREMYMRCLTEREAKLKAITSNIKQSIDKSTPVRSTKLAYVDHFVKPPRNVLRQQAKYGTAKVTTSASDLKKKLITGVAGPSSSSSSSSSSGSSGSSSSSNSSSISSSSANSGSSSSNVERISVPPPPPSRSRAPSSHPIKKTKAPLMAKALQAIKGRYKR